MNPTSYIMSNMVSGYGIHPPQQKRNANPPLKNPKLSAHTDAEKTDWVLGFFINGRPVAVPVKVAETHEIVQFKNDGRWVTLTYCPLTKSAVLYYNLWGSSGLLYNSNLVLFSENDGISLMPQILGKIVNGDLFDQIVPGARVYQTTRYTWESQFPGTLWVNGRKGVKYLSKYDQQSTPSFPIMHRPPVIPGRSPKDMVVGFNLNGNYYCVFDEDVQPGQTLYVENIDNVTVYGVMEAPESIQIRRNSLGAIDIVYKGEKLVAVDCHFFAWYANFPASFIVGYNLQIIESLNDLYPWLDKLY